MAHELISDFPVVVELPVQWGDMDSYQHVNNAVYFRYFESARLDYFRQLDWFEYEKQTGIGPILARTDAHYRRPLTYPDTISVGASIIQFAEDRFIMAYKLVSHSQNTVTTEGSGTIVTYDYRNSKKVAIPEELVQRIEALQNRSS